MAYTATQNTLAMRVLLYFIDNPDEELLARDIKVKMGVRTKNVLEKLRPLIDNGVIERRPYVRSRHCYAAGPRLLALRQGVAQCQAPQQ